MSRKRVCCVADCGDKTLPRYSIPRENVVRSIWLERIGNAKLQTLNINTPNLLSYYMVCDRHFDAMCKDVNGKLLKHALPTLNLPEFNSPSTEEYCFYRPKEPVQFVTPEKVRDALRAIVESSSTSNLETAVDENEILNMTQRPIKTYQRLPRKSLQFIDPNLPSTSGSIPSTSDLSEVSDVPRTPSPLPGPSGVNRKFSSSCNTHVNKSRGLLSMVGVTRQMDLTPKAKTLYKRGRFLQKSAAALRAKRISTRRKLKFVASNLESLRFVNEITSKFILSQQRLQKFKSRGRRYTIDDKILALSIYKQSGKTYKFLSQFFSLPSRKVLNSLLHKIPFNCGINTAVVEYLKRRVQKLSPNNKNCVIMFDEISLAPGLQYDQKNDKLVGFVDFGEAERRPEFADHALFFLIKGICKKWKMPFCFYFCSGTTPTTDLVRIIKTVVRKVRETGLDVMATISDQGATNQAAIRNLLETTNSHFVRQNVDNRLQGYLIDGVEVVHIYDFPHLIKGLRNGLLTKDLHFTQNGVNKVARWEFIEQLYRMDKRRGNYSQFVKLTDEHVIRGQIKKMRVKNCTQVFSHSVGTALHLAAQLSRELSPQSEYYIDPKAEETADLILFLDSLFDSINGSLLNPPPGKDLLCVVSKKTNHVCFWKTCIPVLHSMYFSCAKTPKTITPSIKNWIFSLESMIYLTSKLIDNGFKFVAPRNFNQDPIENYFSCVRSFAGPNVNPTCFSFVNTNKALLVNNLTSPRTLHSNCEADDSEGILDNLRSFLVDNVDIEFIRPEIESVRFPEVPKVKACFIQTYTTAYISGFVARKICSLRNCEDCRRQMCSQSDVPINILIKKREYPKYSLTHPSTKFSEVFKKCTELLLNTIPTFCIMYSIKAQLRLLLQSRLRDEISGLFCEAHDSNVDMFVQTTVNIVLHNYIANINRILSGKDVRRVNQDTLTKLASTKCKKTWKGRY